MGDERHATRQRLQHGRSASDGVGLERLAAREHQHDQRPGEVLAEQDRRDDGDAGQQVGAELAPHELSESDRTSGTPPAASASSSGRSRRAGEVSLKKRNARCAAMPVKASAAMTDVHARWC